VLNPRLYLKLAEELSSRPESHATRTAADKAYCAAYLTCRDELAVKDYLIPNYDREDHMLVQSALRRKEVMGSFGDQMSQLRRARNCVLYDTRELTLGHINARPLAWMLQTAKELIDRVDKLAPRS